MDIHFDNCGKEFREVFEKVRDDIYVDDLVTGGESINEVKKLKSDSITLFQQGGFKLHEWHSNETILETNNPCNTTELNFAKQQLGTKADETKILGIFWDKQSDSFIIKIPNFSKRLTKRNILQALASIYDALGFTSLCLLTGKLICQNVCDSKKKSKPMVKMDKRST